MLLAVSAAALAWPVRPADACTPFVNAAYETDRRHGTDALPPGPVTASAEFAAIPADDECGLGRGVLTVDASATDDLSGSDVGFVLRNLEVRPFTPADQPKVPDVLDTLVYYTVSASPPEGVEIAAVDRFGHVGPWTPLVVVDVTPPDRGGCAAGEGGSAGVALLVLALWAAPRRRGRRVRAAVS